MGMGQNDGINLGGVEGEISLILFSVSLETFRNPIKYDGNRFLSDNKNRLLVRLHLKT
jgi:hypothetical protein